MKVLMVICKACLGGLGRYAHSDRCLLETSRGCVKGLAKTVCVSYCTYVIAIYMCWVEGIVLTENKRMSVAI